MNRTRRRAAALALGVMSLRPGIAGAQEVLVEADASHNPPESRVRKVHGDVRFGAGEGDQRRSPRGAFPRKLLAELAVRAEQQDHATTPSRSPR